MRMRRWLSEDEIVRGDLIGRYTEEDGKFAVEPHDRASCALTDRNIGKAVRRREEQKIFSIGKVGDDIKTVETRPGQDESIAPRPAREDVDATLPFQNVVSVTTEDRIPAIACKEMIVGTVAGQDRKSVV